MELVIFDLETTGLSPYQHEIIQIAGVRMKAGRILEKEFFSTYVKPRAVISPFITRYTGITNDHVKGTPKAKDALVEFSSFVGDAVLIAHNGKTFDMPFIRESCARSRLPVREVGFVDSMAFSRKIWGGRGGHSLDAVMERLRLKAKDNRRHDARGDVRILAEAVRRMWGKLTPSYKTCPVECDTGWLPR